jgi:uncharacterized RDD family membrane protein YckC
MDFPIASRKRRICALLIDFWFYGYLTSLCAYFTFFVFKTPWDSPFIQNSFNLPTLIAFFGFIIFANKDGFKGTGLGKILMGIRVMHKSGAPASPARTLLRNIPLMAWPIETLVMVISSSKRRIGDYLAKTQVKRDLSMATSHRGLAALFIVCFYLFTPSLPDIDFSEDGFMKLSQIIVKQSHAYELAKEKIYEQEAIVKLIGPIKTINVGHTSTVSIYNDEGEAKLILDVQGENKNLPVIVKLKRTNGQWELTEMYFEQTQNVPIM